MHNDHLTEFSNLVFLSMGCYCLACKPCTRRTTWLSGHFREDLYGLGHVTGWELYDLHDLVHVSRVGYIDISSVGYINISTIPRESRKSTPEMCFFFTFCWSCPQTGIGSTTISAGQNSLSAALSATEFLYLRRTCSLSRAVSKSRATAAHGGPELSSFWWILRRRFGSADCLRRCPFVSATRTP